MQIYPDLEGKVVLVTGGANGIGAAMVRAFCEQSARVYFCDVDVRAGRLLEGASGSGSHFSKVDLRRERQVCRWIRDIGARGRKVHVLVNNAATDPRIPLHKTTVAQWDDLFARNLRAFFLTSREATKWMSHGASIINLASITFYNSPAKMAAYVATKGGVLGFTRSLARELGPRRIRVNALSPGWIMTERQLRQYVTPAIRRLIKSSQSIPDLIQPEEIARVALFLASESSAAITGQEILVDRGWEHS